MYTVYLNSCNYITLARLEENCIMCIISMNVLVVNSQTIQKGAVTSGPDVLDYEEGLLTEGGPKCDA